MIPNQHEIAVGRDTDALIAEYFFGWQREKVPPDASGENGGNDVLIPPGLELGKPHGWQWPNQGRVAFEAFTNPWSSNLERATQVWDRLAAQGWQCSLVDKPYAEVPEERWVVGS